MVEFFKDWRQKVGGVTLLMACVLMIGWVRSATVADAVSVVASPTTLCVIKSSDGGIMWLRFNYATPASTVGETTAESLPHNHNNWFYSKGDWRFEDGRSDIFGYDGFGYSVSSDGGSVWLFPYWLVVIPLTLLSAYLLLSKRRKPTSGPTQS